MIIVDFGSANTCKNDVAYVHRMIDELADVDAHKREVYIKWQLFLQESAPQCVRLDELVFQDAYDYAEKKGYRTTASVFDVYSLNVLLEYDVPFVKIAAREWCYYLIERVPRGILVVVSVVNMNDAIKYMLRENMRIMCCVPEYPAPIASYELTFTDPMLHRGISDHSPNLYLWKDYTPQTYERHLKLADSTGADAGVFASLPSELAEVIG